MKILQLCSYYSTSPLYKNLFESLDSHLFQHVYVPYQQNQKKLYTNRYLPNLKNSTIAYKPLWKSYNRVFYRNKINRAINDIELGKHTEFDLIHAHTWFSDGGIAYQLFQKTMLPYVVTIRNTDINYFYNYRFDLHNYGNKILLNASKIIFISHAYIFNLKKLLPNKIYSSIDHKFEVIPNGIDDFWFTRSETKKPKNIIKNIIYIGDINKNKNIELLIHAYLQIKSKKNIGKLKIVGFSGTSDYEKRIYNKHNNSEDIQLIEKVPKEELKNLFYDSEIFVMVSHKETFGLVYIEALSQGLPIVYSKGQGVDGYFEISRVGEKVNHTDVNMIGESILKIANNYSEYQKNTKMEALNFRWCDIGLRYNELYKNIK